VPKMIPIYTDHDEKYIADSCTRLAQAAAEKKIHVEVLSHGHYPGRALGRGVLPGLKMAGYWDTNSDQDWGLPWHRNEGIELTLLERGFLKFATEEGGYWARANDMTIVRPWQRHRIGDPCIGPSRLNWVLIDIGVRRPHQEWKWPPWVVLSPADLDELTKILRQNERPMWRATPQMRRCFQNIAKCVEVDSDQGSISRLSLQLNELLLLLLGMLRHEGVELDDALTTSRRTVRLFLNDLCEHPEHLSLNWTVTKMAEACGLGVTQFISHVKSLEGVTPLQYILRCRLERGATILKGSPSAGITETALDCGFSSSQYFATVFAKRFGCSPKEYRRANHA
jgi:AraC-like DNA-binding protein